MKNIMEGLGTVAQVIIGGFAFLLFIAWSLVPIVVLVLIAKLIWMAL